MRKLAGATRAVHGCLAQKKQIAARRTNAARERQQNSAIFTDIHVRPRAATRGSCSAFLAFFRAEIRKQFSTLFSLSLTSRASQIIFLLFYFRRGAAGKACAFSRERAPRRDAPAR